MAWTSVTQFTIDSFRDFVRTCLLNSYWNDPTDYLGCFCLLFPLFSIVNGNTAIIKCFRLEIVFDSVVLSFPTQWTNLWSLKLLQRDGIKTVDFQWVIFCNNWMCALLFVCTYTFYSLSEQFDVWCLRKPI